MVLSDKRMVDRRVHKTKKLLHQALASLIQEKPYDAIVVKEILDRADVGRSTFYAHFRDKDDLLVSGIHDMLRSVHATTQVSGKPYERVLKFSLPIFEHIHEHRRTVIDANMGNRGRAIIHEHLRTVLTQLIGNDIERHYRSRRNHAGQLTPDLLIQYVASTFILVLTWWVENRNPMRPKEVNALFHSLTVPVLSTALT